VASPSTERPQALSLFRRYPTFTDAIRDIDDALCMIFLFASLPSNDRISASLVENCSRLAAEWQLYVMRTHSLRKVFLSIKGVYYQAEAMDQTVTWLIPYQFTQNVGYIHYINLSVE
jgi:pescadillo protein